MGQTQEVKTPAPERGAIIRLDVEVSAFIDREEYVLKRIFVSEHDKDNANVAVSRKIEITDPMGFFEPLTLPIQEAVTMVAKAVNEGIGVRRNGVGRVRLSLVAIVENGADRNDGHFIQGMSNVTVLKATEWWANRDGRELAAKMAKEENAPYELANSFVLTPRVEVEGLPVMDRDLKNAVASAAHKLDSHLRLFRANA
jgi:hypothetical protein